MKRWHWILAGAVALVVVGIWTGDGRWALSGAVIAAALVMAGIGAAIVGPDPAGPVESDVDEDQAADDGTLPGDPR